MVSVVPRRKAVPGRGSSARISASMSSRSSSSTPQIRFSACEIAPGQQFEVGDKRLHGRIEAVARRKLQRQAFGEVAGKQAGRIEGLADRQHPSTSARPIAEPFGDLAEIGAQIAGLVEPVGKLGGDQPCRRIGEGEARSARRHGRAASRAAAAKSSTIEAFGRADRVPSPAGRFPLRREVRDRAAAWCRDHRERCFPARRRTCPAIASALERRHCPRRTSRHLRRRFRLRLGSAARPRLRRRGSARSSSGLRSISSSTKRSSSKCVSCSSRIDCISCGVITRDCDWRSCSLAASAMVGY